MLNHRIIFMGSPIIASEYLEVLIKNKLNIISVYTQPPRPKGRGMALQKTSVHQEALKNKIPVFYPNNFTDPESLNSFVKLKPDLVIVMAYGMLIPTKILNLPKFGCINIHISLLPRWRGASPVEHALLNNDKKTGVTIFRLTNKLDAGPVITQESIKISQNLNKESLINKLNDLGKKLIINTLPSYLKNKIVLHDQNEDKVTYAPKINSQMTKIDFYKNAVDVFNQIRAFSPKPGAWFLYKNERFKIIKCEIINKQSIASTIVNENFHIGCKDGVIVPKIIQREGKIALKIEDFLMGFKFFVGQKINA